MLNLLVLRSKLKSFYGKYNVFIVPAVKFAFVLCALLLLNKNIGYMKMLKNPFVPVILSLICSVMPFGGICWIISGFMLMHIYAVSSEMTLVMVIFLMITALLYYGFQPGDSWILILTPMMFAFKIPYVVPVLVGLSCGMVSVVPVGCGIVLYYMLSYVKKNAGLLTNDAAMDITQKYMQMINGIVSNKTMLLLIVAFAVTIIVVFLIRNLSLDYSWIIAVITGLVALLVTVLAGDFLFGISVAVSPLLTGILIAAAVAVVYIFMVFNVDYTRTEYTQFEDDDYYYYVKAVPKITVSVPERRVQRMNRQKHTENEGKEQ